MNETVRASPWPLLRLLNWSGGERTPALLRPLTGHTGEVTSVAFSADGRHIVSGSRDQTVKVWDARTGQERLTLKGHTVGVTSVAFSPDGKRIVSGSGRSDRQGNRLPG